MSERLETFMGRLSDADSLSALTETVHATRDVFGVEHVVFHATKPDGALWSAVTYDPAWVGTYVSENLQAVDPVVRGCIRGFTPIDWKRLDWSSKKARAVLHEGIAHGIGNQGVSIPIRGPSGQFSVFTVNGNADDDSWAKQTAAIRNEMLLAGHYINEKVLSFADAEDHAPHQELSPRERDALTHLARGANRGQAAEALKISEHTLRVYIESARFKMGAANTTHAVAKAMAGGHICL